MEPATLIIGLAAAFGAGWVLGLVLRSRKVGLPTLGEGRAVPWSIVLLGCAALAALVAGVLAGINIWFMNSSVGAEAQVIEIEESVDETGKSVWAMICQFEGTREAKISIGEGEYKAGDRVRVRHMPNWDGFVRIDSWQRTWNHVSRGAHAAVVLLGLSLGWKRWTRHGTS